MFSRNYQILFYKSLLCNGYHKPIIWLWYKRINNFLFPASKIIQHLFFADAFMNC